MKLYSIEIIVLNIKIFKKSCNENVSDSKQSHVEEPEVNMALEISKERDNENVLLTTSNCDSNPSTVPQQT